MKSRARARVLARRRRRSPWPPWLLLLALAGGAAMFGVAQLAPAAPSESAGAADQPNQGTGDIQTQPPAAGVAKAAPGLLKPKANPDPAMTLPTPNPKEFPTPVIKPPGTAGNPSAVVPR